MSLTDEDKQWIAAQLDGAIERVAERLTRYILDLREETRTRLQAVESRLEILSATMASIDARDSRIPALTKAVVDFGALSSHLLTKQSEQRESASDLAARVA
jgi:hypothetical protein